MSGVMRLCFLYTLGLAVASRDTFCPKFWSSFAALGLAALSRRSVSLLYRDPRPRMNLYRYRIPNIVSSEFVGSKYRL